MGRHGTGETEPLPLAARHAYSELADLRLSAECHCANVLCQCSNTQDRVKCVGTRPVLSEKYVVANRARKQVAFLRCVADQAGWHFARRSRVDQDFTRIKRIEAG